MKGGGENGRRGDGENEGREVEGCEDARARGCGEVSIVFSDLLQRMSNVQDKKSRQIVRCRIVLLTYIPGWGPFPKVRP